MDSESRREAQVSVFPRPVYSNRQHAFSRSLDHGTRHQKVFGSRTFFLCFGPHGRSKRGARASTTRAAASSELS